MTCRSGVVSVVIVVRTVRTTASVLTPEPISLRARTQRSGRVLYTCVRPWRAWAGRAWAGDLDPADPRISPLYDDLSALPPMLIFQGDADILGPDTIEFARAAARAGVDVRLRVEPGGFHVYVLSVPFIPEAVDALDRSARFVTGILRSR